MSSLLSHIDRKADRGSRNSAIADEDGIFELLRLREHDRGGKGQKLEDVLKRHLGRREARSGVLVCVLGKKSELQFKLDNLNP